jgi:hypothetical protein
MKEEIKFSMFILIYLTMYMRNLIVNFFVIWIQAKAKLMWQKGIIMGQ